MFRAGLKSLMENLKLDKRRYNTHSLRIGAATSASLAKLPDTHIQILGRWRSNAFKRYIRPPHEVANMSKVIGLLQLVTTDFLHKLVAFIRTNYCNFNAYVILVVL